MVRRLKEDNKSNRDFYGSKVVLSSELFDLVERRGVNVDNKPFNNLECKSKGLAYKCVVEVRMDSDYFSRYHEDEDIIITKYCGTYVSWGMSSERVDVDDMIYCLEEAKKFADKVEDYLVKTGRNA